MLPMTREEKKKQCKFDVRLIYSMQCRPMIIEAKGEVIAPIVSKIKKKRILIIALYLSSSFFKKEKLLPLLFLFAAN